MRHAHLLALLLVGGCASAKFSDDPDAGNGGGGGGDEADAADPMPGDIDASIGPDAPPGSPDASVDAGVDAAPSGQTWRTDTAAEFAVAGRSTTGAFIDSRGALEPFAYFTGGLLVRASDSGVLGAAASATWAQVQAFPATTSTGIARLVEQAWPSGTTPAGLALTDNDSWTLAYEGEILLETGDWTFTFAADDHGFVELADPATGVFSRVASSDKTAATGTYKATATGWVPIRFAASDVNGDASVSLKYKGPGVASTVTVPRDKLRARVDALRGLAMTGYDDELTMVPTATRLDGTAPANINWGALAPSDLGITDPEDFSVRWTGQLRVDLAGSYAFHYVTDDGARLFIDGANRVPATAWGESVQDVTTAAIPLAVGWHDLVIDQSDHTSTAAATLTVASGPELVGQPLPVARLRPVEARGERTESAVNTTNLSIPGLGTTDDQVTLVAPSTARATSAEVMFQFVHNVPSDLVVSLISPDGEAVTLRNHQDASATRVLQRAVVPLVGTSRVAGKWTVRFSDTVILDGGTAEEIRVTVHYAGGQSPIATPAVYESPVRDLGAVASFDKVTWEERTPTGSDVAVQMRTGATEAACASAAWSAAMTNPAGSTPAVTAQRFAQYRVELTSTGDATPSLEWVQIDYKAAP